MVAMGAGNVNLISLNIHLSIQTMSNAFSIYKTTFTKTMLSLSPTAACSIKYIFSNFLTDHSHCELNFIERNGTTNEFRGINNCKNSNPK